MEQYKKDFVELLVKAEALKFGEFTLKSGRLAPYFFNAGAFYTGELLYKLGGFYAAALLDSGMNPDVIFGPAYKGIPLSVITTGVLYAEHGKSVSYAFDRKEEKTYGAGAGKLVGAPLTPQTKVVLIDDVITAGTAIRATVELLKENGDPSLEGILIALNRMEKGSEGVNAIAELEERLGVPVKAIVTIDEVIEILHNKEVGGKIYIDDAQLEKIQAYRAEYGA